MKPPGDTVTSADTLPGGSGDDEHGVRVVRESVVGLTIAWHPEVARVGERAALLRTAPTALSRLEPLFSAPGATRGRGIDERHVSRTPLVLRVGADGVRIAVGEAATRLVVDGARVADGALVPMEAVRRGAVLELGGHVVLVLHELGGETARGTDHGLVGASSAIERVREQIARVAERDVPVLLRGETGTGKELAAAAIVAASRRAARPFVTANLGAVAPAVAAAQLFGHERGAFTGAVGESAGLFGAAHGGTLLLDEIGEAPAEIQVALLRVLESGEVQPVGAERPRRVDVRVLAATDADLDVLVARGTFRRALLERLAGFTLMLPPLRGRRDDIGRLVQHMLDEEQAVGGGDGPRLGAKIVARLVRYEWPGNVRQLRNVVRQLIIANAGREAIALDETLARLVPASAPCTDAALPAAEGEAAALDDDAIAAALAAHGWRVAAAAKSLGVARNTLVARIDKSPRLRRPRDLSAEDIERCRREVGGDLPKMAAQLGVSERGLALRMRALGIANRAR